MRLQCPESTISARRRPLGWSKILTASIALGLVLALAPAALAERTGDVVLDGVLDLLGAELSDAVILQWLATTEDEPRAPSAQDLILLRKAGASDEVIVALLEKARGELTAPPSTHRVSPAAPAVPGERAAAALEDTVLEDAAGIQPPARAMRPDIQNGVPSPGERRAEDFRLGRRPFTAPPASDAADLVPEGRGAVQTSFVISNTPHWLEGEDPWSLFVYLNGEPLTFVAEGTILSDRPVRFSKLLKPGKQRLMLFREQHDGENNRHFTKVMPRRLEFELAPGGAAEVELSFKQTVISLNDPVSFRVAQNNRLVAEASDIGDSPDRWQWLCDDLERTLDGKGDSRLDDCVQWRELWQGYAGPTRSQVLQAFANFDYRPVPRDQALH